MGTTFEIISNDVLTTLDSLNVPDVFPRAPLIQHTKGSLTEQPTLEALEITRAMDALMEASMLSSVLIAILAVGVLFFLFALPAYSGLKKLSVYCVLSVGAQFEIYAKGTSRKRVPPHSGWAGDSKRRRCWTAIETLERGAIVVSKKSRHLDGDV
jgi:hypothetical protein